MMEWILFSTSLIILSVAMHLLCYFGWVVSRRISEVPIVVDVIFLFVHVKLFFYYFIPSVLRFSSDFKYERIDNVEIRDIFFLYINEFVSWCFWLLAFILMLRFVGKRKMPISVLQLFSHNSALSRFLLVFLSLGFLVSHVYVVAFSLTSYSSAVSSIPAIELIKGVSFYGGIVAAPFLMVVALRYYGWPYFLVGLVCYLLMLSLLSTRGAMIYSTIFLIFIAVFALNLRYLRFIYFLLFAGAIGGGAVGLLSVGGISFDRETEAFSFDVMNKGEKQGYRTFIEEMEWRLGASTRTGTALMRLYDKGEGAGIHPIRNSALGIVPRWLNPDKPHPSSLDGSDIYSQGMYIAFREIYGYDSYSMTEIPTGAHFYWEFGVLGTIILSVISGIYVALASSYFSKLGAVGIPLTVALFKPWGFMDPKIWVSEMVIQVYQFILPLMALVFIYKLVSRFRFRILRIRLI